MSITLIQGLMLSIFAVIAGLDSWLEVLYIFRPIISCTVAGFILGDPTLGIMAGGLTELTFAGLTPAGGTQPPNPAVCGIMTVVIAHTASVGPSTAIGLSLPFAMLMQYILLMCYSLFSVFMPVMDKAAAEGNTKKFASVPYLIMAIVGVLFFVVIFLSAYAAQGPMQALVKAMPVWLIHGFELAGSALPAVGFAMLLKVLLRVEYVPYLLLGFVVASFINFSNVLPAAVIGIVFAIIEFFRDKKNKQLQEQIEALKEAGINGGEEDGI
ncbi:MULTISPECIES: PTS galactosamine transporter subunit IIC [Pediococcus]|uniref:PTS galactosamine transporter subunit IIC n=1 Tax=Pediococcus TaxID=1253 RepID=UPI000324E616|nr:MULTISPECIES: PTS galactosamine transporter subunit IIC [Pediococcus]KAF5438702.1 PTS N-acetylgalactosamine transporter subunit IIC [Pediococcus sp. EKM202D]KAF5438833.1 PTS N-acetylgalactosamine transporter subunit IIC [Pediococcus sp. EKM201D]QHM65176.1 N-acetylgalactosamine permease IIC component 1 [Pediococcus pentosaceus]QHM66895.1 N-acetylgalactosamine permease IIC component 1 [Pediococcus pentosaceus]QHM68951.1 N-acetylgalactosamine permease IIC component 1 [Pediococcus pentosaceus]